MAEKSGAAVLVTGATGFIGGRLAERLVDEGTSLRLLVRDPARLAPPLRAAADVVTGGLGDAEALGRAVRGVSVIYHCAANVHTWDKPEAYEAANVEGVKNLLAAVSRENPGLSRLVHVSTVDVYGFPVTPCDEKCETLPSGFGYGDSKRRGEMLVRDFGAATGIAYTILRPANVIGPRSQFIERIGKELKTGLMLKIDGGRANAGFVYIDNLVDYMLWAATASKAAGQCYNVRDNYDVDWATFLAGFRKMIGGRGLVISLPYAAAQAAARLIQGVYRLTLPRQEPLLHPLIVKLFGRTCGHSAAKLRADSGFEGRTNFEAAMEMSVRWFLARKTD